MSPHEQPAPYFDFVAAPSPSDPSRTVKLGMRQLTFHRFRDLGFAAGIAQYYGIVQDGLIVAQHAFRGLQRPLMLGDDTNADQPVVIYSWRPEFDCEWSGYPWDGTVVRLEPPPHRVFVVLVREEPHNEFGVFGSIEKWNWVGEDAVLKGAPTDWQARYKEHLWSRFIP